MPQIHFGLSIPADALDPTRRHLYMTDVNRLLETVKGHYHSAWLIDHLQFGGLDVLEGWTSLTYLSALHPELYWGNSVLCQSFRNPALLAKMAATVQFLTGGRFIFGIGAGWNEEEYLSYGYPFPSPAIRVEELDEALQIIKALWTEPQATFHGTHHHISGAYCEPKPSPIPPIMLGAFGPKMLRLTARHADWWNVSSTGIDDYRALSTQLDRACREIGRDSATLRRTWCGGCICAPTEREVAALASVRLQMGEDFAHDPGKDFVGTPEQLVEQIEPFIDLGVDYFILDCGGFPDLTTVHTHIEYVLTVLNA